jgi:hypothetical protein
MPTVTRHFNWDRDNKDPSRIQNDALDLLVKVDAILGDWHSAAARLAGARAVAAAAPELAAIDAARLLEVTLHANVLACSRFAVGRAGSALTLRWEGVPPGANRRATVTASGS